MRKFMTIRMWCENHCCARVTYYRRAKAGLAPRPLKIGRRTLIDVAEAEALDAKLLASPIQSMAA